MSINMLRQIVFLCLPVPMLGASNGALVASLDGSATVDQSKPVTKFQWIADGAVLKTGANSKAVVILLNGHRFEMGANAQAKIGAAQLWNTSGPVRELDPLPPMPKPGALKLATGGGAAGSFRVGSDTSLTEMCPREGMAALPGPVKLSFHPVEGATAYQIVVADANGDTVAEERSTRAEIAVTLRPGSQYSWRVRAFGPGGVVAEAQAAFVTLPSDQAEIRRAFAAAAGANSAVLAEVDFANGLICEAAAEFRAALRTNPSDPAIRAALEKAQAALEGK